VNHLITRASVAERALRNTFLSPLVLMLFVLCGCASVPPQTANLSSTVGTDLLALQESHRFYINAFYDRLVAEANRLIDREYTPKLVSAALNGQSGKVLMQKIEASGSSSQGAQDATAFMERFLQNLKLRIDKERTSVVASIETARRQALTQVDAAYFQVVRGNSTVTAYLVSLVKLQEAQQELLTAVGLPNLQDETAEKLAQASDAVGTVLTRAEMGEKTIDDVKQSLEDLKELVIGKNEENNDGNGSGAR
jgi:hypothetical protein